MTNFGCVRSLFHLYPPPFRSLKIIYYRFGLVNFLPFYSNSFQIPVTTTFQFRSNDLKYVPQKFFSTENWIWAETVKLCIAVLPILLLNKNRKYCSCLWKSITIQCFEIIFQVGGTAMQNYQISATYI